MFYLNGCCLRLDLWTQGGPDQQEVIFKGVSGVARGTRLDSNIELLLLQLLLTVAAAVAVAIAVSADCLLT